MINLKDVSEKLQLEAKLRMALVRKEFQLDYQPKVNLHTGKIVGVEALIRWEHPEKGLVPPSEFISIAEDTGLILPIGEWALRTACRQNKTWQDAGLPPMIVAVNLSARQLHQPDLVDKVKQILEETKLEPKYLELELTENILINVHQVIPILKKLKQIGVRISLDDFGTGYSSLHYLKELPIDIIKIDRSFIRTCTSDYKDATIVKIIITMAHQLNMEVIAEGIEEKEQLLFLQQNHCPLGQGYLFSKPFQPEELAKRMNRIEQILQQEGMAEELNEQRYLEKALESARLEMQETIRNQQGMILKFVNQNGKYIHTFCDGGLLYKMKLTPELVIGRELHEFLPKNVADRKLQCYQEAFTSGEDVQYEVEIYGLLYFCSLRPIVKDGKVIEVIGSCVDLTDRKKDSMGSVLADVKIKTE